VSTARPGIAAKPLGQADTASKYVVTDKPETAVTFPLLVNQEVSK